MANDIEKLLAEAGSSPPAPAPPPPAAPPEPEADIAPHDIDYLLTQAERALQSVDAVGEGGLPSGVSSYRLEEFSGGPDAAETATLDLVRDVELDVKIELGRTQMYLEDVLRLRKGSVVPLDKLAGDPVDIYVNQRLVARGEVLVLNDNFCVRVAELIVGGDVSS
jgi:flagellar motor switch protein FliN/FliY